MTRAATQKYRRLCTRCISCPGYWQSDAQVNLALGTLHGLRGELSAARACWQTTIVAARAANLKSLEYHAHTNADITFYQDGDLTRALEHYQAALLGARALADSNLAARVLSNMAILYHLRGELDTALAAAAQARELREQMGDRLGVANVDNTHASILLA
jgi:tetratricopeptide (TPR) repeat protein